LANHYAGRYFVYDFVDEGLESLFEKYQDEQFKAHGMVIVPENHFFNKLSKRHISRARSWIPRYLETNRLGSEFIFCLHGNAGGVLMPLRMIGAFLDFVPCRLGQNVALDDAIACICAIYHSRDPTPFTANKKVRQSYTKAITSVRTHLSNPATRMDSDVLCASILLQFFEVSPACHILFE
jgi:hypothetical protein